MPVETLIQHRRDTAAKWLSVNPVLASGEIGVETDTNKFKIGDGVTPWAALAYQGGGLPGGGLTGQVLAKQSDATGDVYWADANGVTTQLKKYVMNKTGAVIPKGSAVYISGADGNNPLISLAKADAEETSSKTLGLVENDIADNAKGYVVMEGSLSGLNTQSATEGDAIWLSPLTAGGLVFWHAGGTTTKPSAPNHLVYLGVVVKKSSGNGVVEVKVRNGYELEELHNVDITSPANGDTIVYDSSSQTWKNQASSSVGTSYTHTQNSAQTTWTITHNLGIFPNVTTQDSAGTTIEGDVTYVTVDSLTVSFATATTGKAYLS